MVEWDIILFVHIFLIIYSYPNIDSHCSLYFYYVFLNNMWACWQEKNKVWFVSQSNYVKYNIKRVFDEVDTIQDGVIGREEICALLKKLAPQMISEDSITEAMEACYQSGSKDTIYFEDFSDWYLQNIFCTGNKRTWSRMMVKLNKRSLS